MTTPRDAGLQSATMQLFQRALATAPIVLWAIDRDGHYTMSEGNGLALLGMEPGESVGLSALEMFKDNPAVAKALAQALAGDESHAVTSTAPGVSVENWCMPLRGDDGQVTGAVGLTVAHRGACAEPAIATPIIQVWDEVLCLPIIGTLDADRTAAMMQSLLESIVREQARYAIVDLTGVEIVDTSTADHLVVLFRAARVLGVEGVLCGIRPAVAQTIVGLGLDLGTIKTMRSLRDALKWCIRARADQNAGAAPRDPAAGKARP